MAGSYRHLLDKNGDFQDFRFISGRTLGKTTLGIERLMLELRILDEKATMLEDLTGGDRQKIFEAWKEGYFKRFCPPENNPGTAEDFWEDHGGTTQRVKI